jgi:hypothetical protein
MKTVVLCTPNGFSNRRSARAARRAAARPRAPLARSSFTVASTLLLLSASGSGCGSSNNGPGPGPSVDAGTDLDSNAPLDASTPIDASSPDAPAADAAPDSGAPTVVPSNFSLSAVTTTGIGDVNVDGTNGNCAIDTDMGTISCNNQTTPYPFAVTPVTLTGGAGHATLFSVASFEVATGINLRVTGSKPAILYSLGPVDIQGVIDLSAGGAGYSTTNPGAAAAPGTVPVGDAGETSAGGGGASFCGTGGGGAPIVTSGPTDPPGATYGTADLIPLWGGSAAIGNNGWASAGGGLQITSQVSITVEASGGINASGGGGSLNNDQPSGGASGGGVLLESLSVTVAGFIAANGGGGADLTSGGTNGTANTNPAPGGGAAGGAGSGGATVDGQSGTTAVSGSTR